MAKKPKSLFPKHFFWGASTASHQVEGGTENQWSVWELAHAKELAQSAKRRLSWVPAWAQVRDRATSPENYVSGAGVEHYKYYKEDFRIAKAMNLTAFRFGIEWSRIEPEPGVWDEDAIAHYHRYIKELRHKGMEPFLNLWHWTMPTWFTDIGEFSKSSNLYYFDRFVQKISDEFGDELNYIITLNEPNVYASFSYLTGEWVPQETKPLKFLRVYYNLTRAHKRAYRILKSQHAHLQIGIAQQLANIQPQRPHNFFDFLSTKVMRYGWNWWFINRIKRHQDFVGFNYYFTDYYKGFSRKNPTVPLNDLGWYMEPEGLHPLLKRVWAHYKTPIYVTENGLADERDEYREWWLEQTILAMERAISEGVDVRGYFHWSLLDNFEWKYGWWPKFGLVEVDREHGMKRRIRPSAKYYAARIKEIIE